MVVASMDKIVYANDMENDTLSYRRDEHQVHLIGYPLGWIPKRRKAVLTGAVADECRQLIEQKAQGKGWTILQLAIQPDHVHRFIRVWPTDSAADVVKVAPAVRRQGRRPPPW